MISKGRIKYIRSLALKKYRDEARVFVAEGSKTVSDILRRVHGVVLCADDEWLSSNEWCTQRCDEIIAVSPDELRKISSLSSTQHVLAVFPQQGNSDITIDSRSLVLALDGIQDPGNLGTIVRTADWFGISDIFCSRDTADVYNPKAVQSTMGSIARVRVRYTDLHLLINSLPAEMPIYCTALDGDNVYEHPLSTNGIVVMGNEGNGISPTIIAKADHKIFIPRQNRMNDCADSLNVAVATAVICYEFRRKNQIHDRV